MRRTRATNVTAFPVVRRHCSERGVTWDSPHSRPLFTISCADGILRHYLTRLTGYKCHAFKRSRFILNWIKNFLQELLRFGKPNWTGETPFKCILLGMNWNYPDSVRFIRVGVPLIYSPDNTGVILIDRNYRKQN